MALDIARNLKLPPDAVTETFAFLARRGAGKTYGAMVFAEEMLRANAQVVVLDPVAKWWGLRLKKDGKTPAFPIPVFGGPHGDLPLPPEAGEMIAEIIVERGISVVLDLSRFDSDAEQRRFVTQFAKKLYRLKQKQEPPTPLHLFLEEAEEFLPQDQQRDQSHMIGAVKKLIKLGRNYGIGCSLVSQRSADVNKKGLSQVGTLIALQTTSPHDRKAIRDWTHGVGQDAEKVLSDGLPNLGVGEAYVWSPAFDVTKRIKIRTKMTFDTSATPKLRKRKKVALQRLSAKELSAIHDSMASIIDEKEKNDPTKLRHRIRELEKQLQAKPIVEKEVPMLTAKDIKALNKIAAQVQTAAEKTQEATMKLHEIVQRLDVPQNPTAHRQKSPTPIRPMKVPKGRTAVPVLPVHERKNLSYPGGANGAVKLKKGARRMLEAAGRFPGGLTRTQLGILVQMKTTGGTFADYLGTLRRGGLLHVNGQQLQITAEGAAYLESHGIVPSVPSGVDEILAMWSPKLKAGARRMLQTLVEAYPSELQRTALADATGFEVSGGTFADYLGTLRRTGLIVVDGPVVRASEDLFV